MSELASTTDPDVVMCDDGLTRCSYRIDEPEFRAYHDEQFGRPTADDRVIFEKLAVEVFATTLDGCAFRAACVRDRSAFDPPGRT